RRGHLVDNYFGRPPCVQSSERGADRLQPILRWPLIRCGLAFHENFIDQRPNRVRVAAAAFLHEFFRLFSFSGRPDLSEIRLIGPKRWWPFAFPSPPNECFRHDALVLLLTQHFL